MASHDQIGDMLAKIKNAILVKKEHVDIFPSAEKLEIVKILKNEGFIKNFKTTNDEKDEKKSFIRVYLKYDHDGNSAIDGLKRISKPGRRVYKGYKNITKLYNGIGIYIVSTSTGIITDKKAVEGKVGGEVVCSIW
jgi:small subunit ribosomal protein S8